MINGNALRKFGAHASDTQYGRQYRLYAYSEPPQPKQTTWHLLCVVPKQLRDQIIENGAEDVFPHDGDAIELHFNATQAVGGFKKVHVISCQSNASAKDPFGTAALLEVEGMLEKPYMYYEKNETNFKAMLLID